MKHLSCVSLPLFFLIWALQLGGCGDGRNRFDNRSSWVNRWNTIAITASGRDHTRPQAGDRWTFGQQMGPTRSSRALAIVHLAIYDAVMAIEPRYRQYLETPRAPAGSSMKAAIAQAAHDTLVELYPSQAYVFDEALALDLSHVEDEQAREDGVAVGKLTALQILTERTGDGAQFSTPGVRSGYSIKDQIGSWTQDPFHPEQEPLTPDWGRVKPFAMQSSSGFRTPPPPALGSAEYADAFAEVLRLGGDGVTTPTERTEEQTQIGFFWGYDGTPSLCAPVKLYNQIAMQVANENGLDIVELARFAAIINVGLADAGIAAWESKYYWNLWRPVVAIREADRDSNDGTAGVPDFTPLGAPAVNGSGRNFTPPFPAYPSGHAVFGGTLFELLRTYFGTDSYNLAFVSEEYNGTTVDQYGHKRPFLPRRFSSFSQAEEENGQSRIYLGIHWKFDKTEGIAQGHKVAQAVINLPTFNNN